RSVPEPANCPEGVWLLAREGCRKRSTLGGSAPRVAAGVGTGWVELLPEDLALLNIPDTSRNWNPPLPRARRPCFVEPSAWSKTPLRVSSCGTGANPPRGFLSSTFYTI